MFAVKGWNVDATALKPQTEVFKTATVTDQNGEKKQGKKRKRKDAATGQNEDVGKLWEQHVEGKDPKKSTKQGMMESKKQKLDKDRAKVDTTRDAGKTEKQERESKSENDQSVGKDGKKDKKDKKKDKKQRETQQQGDAVAEKPAKNKTAESSATPSIPALPAGAKLTPMQSAMRQKLISARFRHLNQTLYTEPSAKALDLFDQNPEMFEDYHSGFRQQVVVWPENPVDNFIATIQARGKVRLQSQKKAFKDKKKSNDDEAQSNGKSLAALPRTHGTCTIADLGCGDARLAYTLKSTNNLQNLQVKILSYDLHSPSPLVTKADISNLPTPDGSVDVAIFCLALMGTNWISFIEEAYRILHWKGELWVSEIKSRFGRAGSKQRVVEHSVGGKRKQAALKKTQEAKKRDAEEVNEQEALAVEVDGVETQNQETDVSGFVDVLRRRGFLLKDGENSVDLSNKMFVKMEFVKAASPVKGKNFKEDDRKKPVERFKKAKFLDEKKDADDVPTDDEGKVLKPCLYKIR